MLFSSSDVGNGAGKHAEPDRDSKLTILREDDEYFFEDVIFLVEDYLFKVPRHEFVSNSDHFRDLFSQPDGSSKERPLRLKNIKRCDFKNFLRVLYPRNGFQSPDHDFSRTQWISILKLATMWNFEGIRELAICELGLLMSDELSPVEVVVLSMTYKIESWLLPALNKLAQRAEPITPEEGEQLGMVTALKIAAIRECCLRTTVITDAMNRYGDVVTTTEETVDSLLRKRGGMHSVDFSENIKDSFSL